MIRSGFSLRRDDEEGTALASKMLPRWRQRHDVDCRRCGGVIVATESGDYGPRRSRFVVGGGTRRNQLRVLDAPIRDLSIDPDGTSVG